MYDELVKRMRTATTLPVMNALCQEAADAIEELWKKYLASEVDATNLTGWLAEEHAKHLWIPVTERLPKKRGWYLANVLSLGVRWGEITTEDSEWIQLVFYHEGKFHKLTGSNAKVTHWMPLPQPPKEG